MDTRTSALIAYSSNDWSRSIEAPQAHAYRDRSMKYEINELSRASYRELGTLVARFSDGDGIRRTAIGGLQCIQLSEIQQQLPVVCQPCICVIVQGAKRTLLEDEIYTYAPPQFLAVSVDLPLTSQVLEASREVPYLSLVVDIDARLIADLIAQSGDASWTRGETSRGLFVGEADAGLLESILRLARLLTTPRDIAALAPLAMREFHYRLLSGPHGAAIAQIAIAGSNTHKIGQVIRHIKTQLATTLRVEDLAAMANMSASSFHQHFKAVTAMSPLQYQKQLRLTEARQILLAEKADAASAAYRVGYQSVSQFSREYARMFGAPPIRDMDSLRS